MTSAIVGVSSTQSVRLNLLNLQPVLPGVTALVCPATLAFYDDSGALLKQMSFSTVAPAAAINLSFKPTVSSTAANGRAQLRALVITPIPQTPMTISGPTSILIPVPVCSLFASFEVTDDATGISQILTTDFRPVRSVNAVTGTSVR
jgi:hypothetical protein